MPPIAIEKCFRNFDLIAAMRRTRRANCHFSRRRGGEKNEVPKCSSLLSVILEKRETLVSILENALWDYGRGIHAKRNKV